MDQPEEPRIEVVRGEPIDEIKFLILWAWEQFRDTLPAEFWEHLGEARHELRAALIVLLKYALERLRREEEAEKAHISKQRGKIDIDPHYTPPSASPPLAARRDSPRPDPTKTSRQRGKIQLD